MTNSEYGHLLKAHLSTYKKHTLGIKDDGEWKRNKKPYTHILPETNTKLNILTSYRDEFWEYFEKRKNGIKLHPDFNHLNSSQAMCFNLFFPFLYEKKLDLLSEVLSIPEDEVIEAEFEKVLDKDEGTNFDFFMEMGSDAQILFEMKLSEQEFGTAKADEKHIEKLERIYLSRLKGKTGEEYLKEPLFFEHYQLLRNISYLRPDNADLLFLIFPVRNKKLTGTTEILDRMLSDNFRDKVKVICLEELINLISFKCTVNACMSKHFEKFREKYIIP